MANQNVGASQTPVLYEVLVTTSGVSGAGTDAIVYLDIKGARGSLGKVALGATSDAKKLFESNQTDKFQVQAASWLGDLTGVVVGHDNSGGFARWHLSEVKIVDPTNGNTYTFACNAWVDDDGTGKHERTLTVSSVACPPAPAPAASSSSSSAAASPSKRGAPAPIKYRIMVNTSDVLGAGTDANVFIELCGAKGKSAKLPLVAAADSAANAKLFERNQADTFIIQHPPLGRLSEIWVSHDGTGVGARWHLKDIKVFDPTTNYWYGFYCGGWLEEGRSLLKVVNPRPPTPPRAGFVPAKAVGAGAAAGASAVSKSKPAGIGATAATARAPTKASPRSPGSLWAAGEPVTYTITVTTSDVQGAGTDAGVYIEAKGRNGTIPRRFLSAAGDGTIAGSAKLDKKLFERNQTDTFSVSSPWAGDLLEIVIGHDGGGNFPRWHLGDVRIHDPQTDHTYVFHCNAWLDLDPATGKHERTLRCANPRKPPAAAAAPSSSPARRTDATAAAGGGKQPGTTSARGGAGPAAPPKSGGGGAGSSAVIRPAPTKRPVEGTVRYVVTVFTSDVQGAGTDAKVYVDIKGTNGTLGQQLLTQAEDEKALFERGEADFFTFENTWLGELQSVTIGHDGSGTFPRWHLDRVYVEDPHNNYRYEFPCGEWVDADEQGRYQVELRVANPNPNCKTYPPPPPPVATTKRSGQQAASGAHGGGSARAGRSSTRGVSFAPASKGKQGASNRGAAHGDEADKDAAAQDINVTYTISVSTSDVQGAGTDAKVYVDIKGTNGSLGQQQLTATVDGKADRKPFERNQVDAFAVDSAWLGEPQSLVIGHDGSGAFPRWHLDAVRVYDPFNDYTYEFHGGMWVDADEQGRHQVELRVANLNPNPKQPPSGGAAASTQGSKTKAAAAAAAALPADTMATYTVTVTTSDVLGSGTDAAVTLNLHGSRGSLPAEQRLDATTAAAGSGSRNLFERGQSDTFTFTTLWLGPLTTAIVSSDNRNLAARWHCRSLSVHDSVDGYTYQFPCNAWVDADAASGGTARRVLPCSNPKHEPDAAPRKSAKRTGAMGALETLREHIFGWTGEQDFLKLKMACTPVVWQLEVSRRRPPRRCKAFADSITGGEGEVFSVLNREVVLLVVVPRSCPFCQKNNICNQPSRRPESIYAWQPAGVSTAHLSATRRCRPNLACLPFPPPLSLQESLLKLKSKAESRERELATLLQEQTIWAEARGAARRQVAVNPLSVRTMRNHNAHDAGASFTLSARTDMPPKLRSLVEDNKVNYVAEQRGLFSFCDCPRVLCCAAVARVARLEPSRRLGHSTSRVSFSNGLQSDLLVTWAIW